MNCEKILEKAVGGSIIDPEEGLYLYRHGTLNDMMFAASVIRKRIVPGKNVGWIIDRNVNITNVCFSHCSFCNFCRKHNSTDSYVTTIGSYKEKIDELYDLGGSQLLLQGGMNPNLGLPWYEDLFRNLKELYPDLKLHALGPPEIVFLAKKERISFSEVIERLISSGLDSLPGAGAEILSDRVRKIISPAKATSEEWLDVMRAAHQYNLPTSATMMYGHIETDEERILHLVRLRELQAEKPEGSYGFVTFVPWPFLDEGTVLRERDGVMSGYTSTGYLRLLAISRIMLYNIKNIQASILTVGREAGILSLHSGANDLGSVMIEENVVSSAGGGNKFNANELQSIIKEAGFVPVQRNQKYESV